MAVVSKCGSPFSEHRCLPVGSKQGTRGIGEAVRHIRTIVREMKQLTVLGKEERLAGLPVCRALVSNDNITMAGRVLT